MSLRENEKRAALLSKATLSKIEELKVL